MGSDPMPFKTLGIALFLLASAFGLFAFSFRADTGEELALGRKADTVVGVMFAVAFLFTRLPPPAANRRGWKCRTAFGTALVWACISGPLLFFHAAVAQLRFARPRTVTLNRVQMAWLAISDYTRDCGAPPPKGHGLEPLLRDPGIGGWAGPYLPPEALTDGWGNAIR
jgi:hypothetical protein